MRLCALVFLLLLGCNDDPEIDPALVGFTRDSHQDRFPIAALPHDLDCSDCHGLLESFLPISCSHGACHPRSVIDATHNGREGYVFSEQTCYQCHPTGVAEGAGNHNLFFPIFAGARHQGTACAKCHVNPATRKDISCSDASCHVAATLGGQHGDVGDFVTEGRTCLRCHADSQVHRVATHSPFGIAGGDKHHREACLTCHPQFRTDKTFAADFRPFACSPCHSPAKDIHFQGAAASCVTVNCHPNGEKP